MNRIFGFLLIAVLWLTASTAWSNERIVQIDAQWKWLTTEMNGNLKFYRVADSTEVTLNGAKASIRDVRPGHTVVVKLYDALLATRIAASGFPRPADERTPKQLRSMVVQMLLDGSSRLLYKDGQFWIEHVGAQKPKEIFINGEEWTPVWDGDKAAPLTTFVVPLAPLGSGRPTVKQLSGRGKSRVERSPLAPVAILCEDGAAGADRMELLISW